MVTQLLEKFYILYVTRKFTTKLTKPRPRQRRWNFAYSTLTPMIDQSRGLYLYATDFALYLSMALQPLWTLAAFSVSSSTHSR
jgi:hypothetical protein